MADSFDYTGCKIVIRNVNTGELLGNTHVLSYAKDRDTIRVSAFGLETVNISDKYIALIFTPDGVDECYCSPRGTYNNHMEYGFALFKHELRNNRSYDRYDVDMKAEIVSVAADGDTGDISRVHFDIRIVNMSATGILFKAPKHTVNIGDVCSVVTKEAQPLNITCKIVRSQNAEMMKEEYGAKLLSVKANKA